jgi:hypothetical protein
MTTDTLAAQTNGHTPDSEAAHPLDGALSYFKLQERGDAMLFAKLMAGKRLYDHTDVWARFEHGVWSYDWKSQSVREISETLTRVYLSLSKHYDDEVLKLTKTAADSSKIEKASGHRDALRKRVDALNKATRVKLYLAAETTDFDQDPHLCNFLNGAYDFRSLAFREHDPNEKIMKRIWRKRSRMRNGNCVRRGAPKLGRGTRKRILSIFTPSRRPASYRKRTRKSSGRSSRKPLRYRRRRRNVPRSTCDGTRPLSIGAGGFSAIWQPKKEPQSARPQRRTS